MIAVLDPQPDDEVAAISEPADGWSIEPAPTRVSWNTLPPEHAEPSDPAHALDTAVDPEVWDRIADCESGDWDADGEPRRDSARWDYGLDFDHGDIFQGGLNFHPDTWDTYRDPDMPRHAGEATRVEEIEIAEQVLDDQGWEAWPVCSEMMDVPEPDEGAGTDASDAAGGGGSGA